MFGFPFYISDAVRIGKWGIVCLIHHQTELLKVISAVHARISIFIFVHILSDDIIAIQEASTNIDRGIYISMPFSKNFQSLVFFWILDPFIVMRRTIQKNTIVNTLSRVLGLSAGVTTAHIFSHKASKFFNGYIPGWDWFKHGSK